MSCTCWWHKVLSGCDLQYVLLVENMYACRHVQVLHERRGLNIPSSVSHVTLCPSAVMHKYLPNELRHTADDIVYSVKHASEYAAWKSHALQLEGGCPCPTDGVGHSCFKPNRHNVA